jgi:hypothetical protein
VLLANLPSHSRLWFFGAHRTLSEHEIEILNEAMAAFVASWTAHGAQLSADFTIQHEAMLIVGVDETVAPPTGCSIDKVFQLLKDFQSKTGIDFFQRTLIWEAFCNTSEIYSVESAKQSIESGKLKSNSLIINTLITQLDQARESMYIPLNESWVAPKLGLKSN